MSSATPTTTTTTSTTTTTTRRNRYQPSRVSTVATDAERAYILEQLKAQGIADMTTVKGDEDLMVVKHLMNRMEVRTVTPGKPICQVGQPTAPSLYIVLSGRVYMHDYDNEAAADDHHHHHHHDDNNSTNDNNNNGKGHDANVITVFGKQELLLKASFRKTEGGKLAASLVTAPYSVTADAYTGCRLAVLTAVAYREVLKKDDQEDDIVVVVDGEGGAGLMAAEEDDDDDDDDDDHSQRDEASNTSQDNDESLPDEQLFDPPLQAVGEGNEAEDTEHTEVSATEGAYEVELVLDEAGRRVALTDIRAMYIPPTNVTQERLWDDTAAITAADNELTKFVRPDYEKSSKEQAHIESALQAHALLQKLPKATRTFVTAAMKKVRVKAGQPLAGDPKQQDKYYCIVTAGECEFAIAGFGHQNRFGAGPGFTFGEEALTCRTKTKTTSDDDNDDENNNNVPLKYNVTAKTDCDVFRIEHTIYRKLVAKDVHEERTAKVKLMEQVTFMESMAYDHLHVSFWESLTTEKREKILEIMQLQEFERDTVIVSKEKSLDTFIMVREGQVECRNMSSELHSKNMDDTTLGVGKHFGGQVLCNEIKHPISAKVVGKSKYGKVYTISRTATAAVIGKPLDLIPIDVRTLVGIEALRTNPNKDLSRDHLLKLSHRFRNKTFKAGKVIVEADKETEACIYVIRDGTASYTKGRMSFSLLPGKCYGEDLFAQCRKANVTSGVPKSTLVAKSNCVVGILTLEGYRDAMKHADDFASLLAAANPKKKSSKKSSKAPKNWPKCSVPLSDLEKTKCLGEGNFGQIWLVRNKSDEQGLVAEKPCVLKIQSKQKLLSMNQVKVAIDEKQALQRLHHPFIVDLLNTYQDDGFVYMLLEYLPGGELYSVLNPSEGPAILPEPLAKFYALCVADALAYMHSRDIIYRDLKPENVLVDREGFPKLIDFGFAKWIDGPTYTLCGTPGYIAPEVLLNVGHGKSYDHWQLGVLIYDMLSFDPPFYDPDDYEFELNRKIMEDPVPKIFGGVSTDAWDLITGLLAKDPKQRIGSFKKGDRDILQHPWFEGLDSSELRAKHIEAPWAPEIAEDDPYDTSQFEDYSELDDVTTCEEYTSPKLTSDQEKLFEALQD